MLPGPDQINDAYRDADSTGMDPSDTMSEPCRRNLEALTPLPDGDEDFDRILRAEVVHELGEIDEARRSLSMVNPGENVWVVDQLLELCDRGDVSVRRLHFGR